MTNKVVEFNFQKGLRGSELNYKTAIAVVRPLHLPHHPPSP